VCACVCVCVRVSACVCVCVCVRSNYLNSPLYSHPSSLSNNEKQKLIYKQTKTKNKTKIATWCRFDYDVTDGDHDVTDRDHDITDTDG